MEARKHGSNQSYGPSRAQTSYRCRTRGARSYLIRRQLGQPDWASGLCSPTRLASRCLQARTPQPWRGMFPRSKGGGGGTSVGRQGLSSCTSIRLLIPSCGPSLSARPANGQTKCAPFCVIQKRPSMHGRGKWPCEAARPRARNRQHRRAMRASPACSPDGRRADGPSPHRALNGWLTAWPHLGFGLPARVVESAVVIRRRPRA